MTPQPPGDSRGALERDVGSQVYRQLLRAFLDLLPQQMAQLRDAAAAGDLDAVRHTAGHITDTAPEFGATSLAAHARGLHEHEERHVPSSVVPLIDDIEDAVHHLVASQRPSGHVLVAEDNLVNQQVAAAMVESLGFTVDVVADGEAAVRAALQTDYDAILMDWHMPVLDGAAAATEIRRRDHRTTRTPIIAVTASSMADQQNRLTAGIDGYLPKPFTAKDLAAVLARSSPSDPPRTSEADHPNPQIPTAKGPASTIKATTTADPTTAPDAAEPVLDTRTTRRLQRLGVSTDRDLLGELAELFVIEANAQLQALHAARADADTNAIARSAHSLRGASANLGATDLTHLCTTLERASRAGDLNAAAPQLDAIDGEVERVRAALDALIATQNQVPTP